MTDLQTAKRNLSGHTICLCKDGNCLYSEQRGIAPMLRFVANDVDLRGYSVVDLVVGKAAAILFARCGIVSVFAKTLSKSGKAVLEKYGIPFAYEVLTENIIDRKGTDICPMEKAVWHTDDLDQAYLLLQQRWAELAEEKTAI